MLIVGCIAGIADQSLWMIYLEATYHYFDPANFPPPSPPDAPFFKRLKGYLDTNSMYHVPSAVEFNCLVGAHLMVLDRIWAPLRYTYARQHSTQKSALQSFAVRNIERIVVVTVSLGFTIIMVARIVVSVYVTQEAKEVNAILLYFSTGLDSSSPQVIAACSSQDKYLKVWPIAVQVTNFCQIIVLIIVDAAYVVTCVLFYKRFRAYVASGQGDLLVEVQRRVSITTLVVFAALALRTSFFAIVGISFGDVNHFFSCENSYTDSFQSRFCHANPCDSCYSSSLTINIWRWYTPLFRSTVFTLSAPLASLVALWGMNSPAKRTQKNDQITPSPTDQITLSPTNSLRGSDGAAQNVDSKLNISVT
jgi:hypothetical protein